MTGVAPEVFREEVEEVDDSAASSQHMEALEEEERQMVEFEEVR